MILYIQFRGRFVFLQYTLCISYRFSRLYELMFVRGGILGFHLDRRLNILHLETNASCQEHCICVVELASQVHPWGLIFVDGSDDMKLFWRAYANHQITPPVSWWCYLCDLQVFILCAEFSVLIRTRQRWICIGRFNDLFTHARYGDWTDLLSIGKLSFLRCSV